MKPGVYPNHERERYDAFDAVNWSTLKELKRSPAHYREALVSPRKQTPAMFGGEMFHLATLEPDRFAAEVVVEPDFGDCRKTENKRRRDEWRDENGSKRVVPVDLYDSVCRMRDSVRANPRAMRYLAAGDAEVSMVWERLGLASKGRIDFLSKAEPAIVDLKRAKDIGRDRFMRQAFNLDYHCQMAFYRDGHKRATGQLPLPCVVIAVEPEPPFDVAVYRYDEDALHYGDETCEELLRHLDYCRKTDRWPGRYDVELTLTLPAWVMGEDDDDLGGMGISFGNATAAQ